MGTVPIWVCVHTTGLVFIFIFYIHHYIFQWRWETLEMICHFISLHHKSLTILPSIALGCAHFWDRLYFCLQGWCVKQSYILMNKENVAAGMCWEKKQVVLKTTHNKILFFNATLCCVKHYSQVCLLTTLIMIRCHTPTKNLGKFNRYCVRRNESNVKEKVGDCAKNRQFLVSLLTVKIHTQLEHVFILRFKINVQMYLKSGISNYSYYSLCIWKGNKPTAS